MAAFVWLGLAVILFVVLMVVLSAVKIVSEYERGVVFRLGRLIGARGPGLVLLIPMVERMVRVDTRVITIDVPAEEVITLDNVTIKVNAVAGVMLVATTAWVVAAVVALWWPTP